MENLARSTVKYEVLVGVPDGMPITNDIFFKDDIRAAWQKYAKEFYDKTNVYVSAITMFGRAIYRTEWGCPHCGESVISFHCTANPEFIKDLNLYKEGVLYISKKLKKEFGQHTITITQLPAGIFYLTDESEEIE